MNRNDGAFCSSVSPQVRYMINPAE